MNSTIGNGRNCWSPFLVSRNRIRYMYMSLRLLYVLQTISSSFVVNLWLVARNHGYRVIGDICFIIHICVLFFFDPLFASLVYLTWTTCISSLTIWCQACRCQCLRHSSYNKVIKGVLDHVPSRNLPDNSIREACQTRWWIDLYNTIQKVNKFELYAFCQFTCNVKTENMKAFLRKIATRQWSYVKNHQEEFLVGSILT